MHFAISIPHAEGYATEKLLASVGLESLYDSYDGGSVANHEVSGVEGKVITWRGSAIPERWWADNQGRYSIGFDRAPTPEDLLRCANGSKEPPTDSFPVTLQDGEPWFVPIARRLPRQWSQGPDGRPTLAPKPAFAWYWDAFTDALSRMEDRGFPPDEPPPDLFEFAVRALALNYRICPEVVYATGLMGPGDVCKVIAAMAEHSYEFTVEHSYAVASKNDTVAQKKTGRRRLVSVT